VTKNQIKEKAISLFLQRSLKVRKAIAHKAIRENMVSGSNKDWDKGKELKE
jgi:hypothetical protein